MEIGQIQTGAHPKHCILQRSLVLQRIFPVIVPSYNGADYTPNTFGNFESTKYASELLEY